MSGIDRNKWPSLAKMMDVENEDDIVESHDGREQLLLSTILSSPKISELKNNPTTILAAIDDFSYHQDFLISIGPHKAGIIQDLVAKEKPKVLVELGGYLGYSAILFADAMKKAHAIDPAGLRLYSLELNAEFADIATQLIALAGLSDIAKVIVGTADESLEKLVKEGDLKDIDLLFLDHAEEIYVKDFEVVEKLGLLKKNGALVVADNVVRPGAPEYRELMRSKAGWKSEGVRGLIWPGEFEDELEVSRFLSGQ